MTDEITTRIALFKGKRIRKTLYNGEWWFVIVDVVVALTDSAQPEGYIKDMMRRRDPELSIGWGQIATPLSIPTAGGPQKLNCANLVPYPLRRFAMITELGGGLSVEIKTVVAETEPLLEVWQVDLFTKISSWKESFPTQERLRAFLRGLEAGAMLCANQYLQRPEIPRPRNV